MTNEAAASYESTDVTTTPSTKEEVEHSDKPVLAEVVEKLGFGCAQIRAGLIGGGVYFADGAELLLISSVTNAVGKSWDLGSSEKSMVVSIVFIGILVGNISSGPIGDACGRKVLILSGFAGIFVFSILSSLTLGIHTLGLTRFFVGMAFGIGGPAWNALGAEVTPANWRIAMQAISQMFFVLGEVYSCALLLIDDPSLQDLHWRWLLQLGAIPSAIFGVAGLLFLNESPAFAAMVGRQTEATRILESMRRDNQCCGARAERVSVDFKVARRRSELPSRQRRLSRRVSAQDFYSGAWAECKKQMSIVFGRQLWLSTLIVIYCCFVLNFLYYGSLYAFPQVLSAEESGEGGEAALQLLIGALWELPGQALGIFCGIYMLRKSNIKLYLSLSSISLLLFNIGMISESRGATVIMNIGYYGIKCFVNIGFVVVYQYSIEIYPTRARTTGSAIAIGSGRLAGVISPLIFEALHERTGGFASFFWLLLGLAIFNFMLVDFLRYETQGRLLKEELSSDDEAEEGKEGKIPEVDMKIETKALLPEKQSKDAFIPEPLSSR